MALHLSRLADYVMAYAQETPKAEAIVFDDYRVNYRQLAHAVDLLARALIRVGVHHGDRVVLVTPPNPEFLVFFLATVRIGAIFVGVDPRQPYDEIESVVHDAKPQVLAGVAKFNNRDIREDLAAIMFSCPDIEEYVIIGGTPHRYGVAFDDFLQAGAGVPINRVEAFAEKVQPDNIAAFVYVPGPTGALKAVMLSHQNFVEVYSRTVDIYPAARVRLINNFPINQIDCLGGALTHALISGGCQVFMETFDAAESIKVVEREKVSVWGQEIGMFHHLVHEPAFGTADFSSLKQIWWTGGTAPPSLVAKLADLPGTCSTRWGIAETCGPVLLSDPEMDAKLLGTVAGQPTRGFDLRLVDGRGRLAGDGEPGRIQVRGGCVMPGYFNRREESLDAFDAQGWLTTSYVATRDEGNDIHIIGALDDLYIGGGFAIHPGEIERVLERHPAVLRAAVLGIADPVHRQVGVAFIQPIPGQQLPVPEIENYANGRLAPHAQLSQIFVREHLPEDLLCRIDRKALKVDARRQMSISSGFRPKRFRGTDNF